MEAGLGPKPYQIEEEGKDLPQECQAPTTRRLTGMPALSYFQFHAQKCTHWSHVAFLKEPLLLLGVGVGGEG